MPWERATLKKTETHANVKQKNQSTSKTKQGYYKKEELLKADVSGHDGRFK